jgi:hypothetical protein
MPSFTSKAKNSQDYLNSDDATRKPTQKEKI